MSILHKFELKDGAFFLDGMRIKGIKEYCLTAKENDSHAELSLRMDVRTLGNNGCPDLDSTVDEFRDI